MDGTDERALYTGLALAAVGVLAVIWATGALAGAVLGSGLAPVAPGETLAVALRLPSHLGDPRAAWPAPPRGRLPGATAMYVCALFILGVMGSLVATAVLAARRLDLSSWPGSTGRGRAPAASWASDRDLALLRVPGPQPRRLTLGRLGRHLLAAEAGQSVIVFGPTSTHKTSGLVIPALLEWEGPVVCTSVKSDLIGPTLGRREELGEVWIFDPAQQTGYERARGTPLSEVADWSGAIRVAHWLASSAKPGSRDLSDAEFWFRNAKKLIAPLLLAAVRSKAPIAKVAAWVDEGPEACGAAVGPILEGAGENDAMRAFLATQNREDRQRSSVYTTAETILEPFAEPRVAAETSGSDFSPDELLDGSNTLYLVAPRGEQERLQSIFSTAIQAIWSRVEERSTKAEGPIEPPLLLVLDECANTAPLPVLDGYASTARGLGVQLVTAFHDISQAEARFGRRAATIVNNHHAKLVGRGISDIATLDYFSRLIGAGEFEQRSVSTQRGARSGRSLTEGDTYRDLAPAHVLRQNAEASALLVYGSLPPTTISMRPWFREPTLMELLGVEDWLQ
ncbi:MAG: type IV secretory system conjugative DNA transfer family protein [Solirubrobacterales bacterium]